MSHMWNPYMPPRGMPPHPHVDDFHVNPHESDYFHQHGGVTQVERGEHQGYYGWPTAPVGTNYASRSPMLLPGFCSPENGEWPRYNTTKRPTLIDSRRPFRSLNGRQDYGYEPGLHANSSHYVGDGFGSANQTIERRSPFGPVHSSSHVSSCEQLAESSHGGRTAQGTTEDLDQQLNRDSSFQHPPIDFSSRQIRLVRVLNTEPGTLIKCKFALSMVDNNSVRYTALSYTWGSASSESDIQKITLHRQEFWVRRNLWCFLRQVRDDPALRTKWYWIDALCIDQAENGRDSQQEKNHQVNMMSQIYRNAHLVITWLGEPESEEYAALTALQDCLDGRSSKKHHELTREGLRYLGDSSYWSRIWIIQEMVLAKRAKLRVGSYDFNWESIYRMRLEARKSNTRLLHDMGWAMTNILDLRQDWYKGTPLDLVTGMRDFGAQKCSDPRDKIYGLLGLMSQKPCTPDYTKSCKALYVEVVLWALRHNLLFRPWHDIDVAGAGLNQITVDPCRPLKLWSIALTLSASECELAQRELADVLGEDWPLIHPWHC